MFFRSKITSVGLVAIFFSFTGILASYGDDQQVEQNTVPGKDQTQKVTKTKKADYSNTQLALLDVSEREFGDINTLALLFNAPLEPDQNFLSHVFVEPSLSEPVLSDDGRTLHFTEILPEKKYTVTVRSGLKSQNKTTLKIGIFGRSTFKITTRPLPATVSFEVDGTVIVPGSTAGLPVMAVNIPEADINVYRVKDEHVQDFFINYRKIARTSAYYFRNIRRANKLTHTYTTRIETGDQNNRRNHVTVPLTALGDLSEPGIYFATISRPGGFEFESATWFSVSSIGLQLREYATSAQVIVQDLNNGQLLDGVDIKILTTNAEVWAEGKTDVNGVINLNPMPKSRTKTFIVARKGNELTFLRYSSPAFDLTGFEVDGPRYREIELFVYSPRDLYRPGENVVISVLKRNADGQSIDGPVNIKILNPNGTEQVSVRKQSRAGNYLLGAMRVQYQTGGYFQFEYDLPENSPLGDWSAIVSSPEDETAATTFKFKVEEFIPERLRLSFNEGRTELLGFGPSEDLKIMVKGEYLYGAPAVGNKLDTTAHLFRWSKPFQNLKGFVFGDTTADLTSEFKFDSVDLDENGIATTRITRNMYDWARLSNPARVRLTYNLYETGGRALTRYKSVLFWPKKSFTGVRPHFKNDRSESNTTVGFDVVRADGQGKMLKGGKAKIELIHEEKKYFWTHTHEKGWHYQTEAKEYVVSSKMLSFEKAEPQSITVPVDWGGYRLELTDMTAKSKTIYKFHAGERWYNAWQSADKNIRPDRVTVALDKKSYRPGDVAKVKIAAPTNGTALVLLEAGGVLHSLQTNLKDKHGEVSMPIPSDLARHDAYISVFVVAPSDVQDKLKNRSFGIVSLSLDRTPRKLEVAFDLPEKWTPEQQVKTSVKVVGANGQAPSGEMFLTLSAVDSGALNLTGYKVKNPHDFFYSQRKYDVRLTDMYENVLEPTLAGAAQTRWGGDANLAHDGGDADLARGGDRPVTEVNILSLFSGRVKVKNGKALIPLDLPAFDGELTLTAVAFGRDSFGMARQVIKVSSSIVAQVSMPRFMALGDHASLALDVTNLTGAPGTASVFFGASGALTSKGIKEQLTLVEGQKKVSNITVQANAIGAGVIVANIKMGEQQVMRSWTLGVRAPAPAEYNRVTMGLKPGAQIDLPNQVLASFIPETTRVQLRIGLNPDLQGSAHFNYLNKYPYNCLEQTTSKSRPFALLSSSEDRQNLDITISDAEVQTKVMEALSRYSQLQLSSGGFGLWSKHSPEEHWLTAYASENLLDLKNSGFNVPDNMIARALGRLGEYLKSRSPLRAKSWLDQPGHYQVAYRAYAAYILAKVGKTTLGPVLDIVERNLENAEGSMPAVHLGLAMIALGDTEEGVRLIEANLAKARSNLYLGDYGSDIRDRAMVLEALLTTKGLPSKLTDRAMQLILPLANDVKQKHWFSPQERSVLFKLAMTLAKQSKDQDWSGELQMAGQTTQIEAVGEYGRNLAMTNFTDAVQFVNTSEQTVYASFAWSGVPKDIKTNIANGIKVTSDYYRISGKKVTLLKAGESLKTGEVILTRIRLTSDEVAPDALLVHLLPAGLELENQNLTNSLKLESINIGGSKVEQKAKFVHQEFRSDRYVAALELNKNVESVVYFITRAVNPGTYIVPPARVESMYKPSLNGTGNTIETLTIIR